MAAVQISNAELNHIPGRYGPYQDSSGNLWIIGLVVSPTRFRAYKSSDGGATWGTTYDYSVGTIRQSWDCVFDSVNGVIYVLIATTGSGLQILSFTIGTTTWARFDSGTGPTVYADISTSNFPAYLTRRSTGEFVVIYGSPHTSMGSSYRGVYYARCSAAGVWSAGVQVDAGGAVHFDCKGACLGDSDRVHMAYYISGTGIAHRSLSSANAFGETPGQTVYNDAGAAVASYYSIYYDSILAKVVISGPESTDYRANSAAGPTWAADSNIYGPSEPAACAPAFIYEPTAAKLYVFYRDYNSDDVYQNREYSPGWLTGYDSGPNSENLYGGSGDRDKLGQTFQCSAGSPKAVFVYLTRAGSPTDSLYAEIRSGSFNGTLLATTDQATPSSNGWLRLSFASPPSLAASTTYYLILIRNGSRDTINYYQWTKNSVGTYSSGEAYYHYSSGWTILSGEDFRFGIGNFGANPSWETAAVQDTATAVTGISVGLLKPPDIVSAPTASGSVSIGYNATTTAQAQSFSFGTNTILRSVRAALLRNGNPTDNLIFEIQTDSSGSPSGTVVGTVATIDPSSISNITPTFYTYNCLIELSGGVTYWLVARRSGSINSSNYYTIDYSASWHSGISKALNTGVWTDGTGDLRAEFYTAATDIGIIFNDTNVYFDKFVLIPPEEPISPTTQNEKFFLVL